MRLEDTDDGLMFVVRWWGFIYDSLEPLLNIHGDV